MSFGFSVGDFLAVIGLVTQLRKDFVDAPSQLRDLSAELKTFSIVLQDTEVDLTESELDPRQLQALESTLSSARDFLQDLQRFIDNHKEIPNSTGSKARGNIKRIWKRLNFDQREVSKFRLQITSIISGLQAFTLNEVKNNTRKIARYVDTQVHKDTLKWLSDDDFNYHKNYQSHLVRNRQAGTRRWLLDSDEWKSWLKSGGQTLYCPGIPGSGKTFTTAMVIENMNSLSEEHGWVFAYVFCNYQQRKENMHEILLRSSLRMLLEQTQQVSEEIQRWPTRNKEVSIDEILEQLRISLKGCTRAFLIVDALDELDEFHTFVSKLFDLQQAIGVNLYFTSRDIPHIRMHFDKAMIVPIKATQHDVGVYLDHQMRLSSVPSFVRSNQALQDEIKETIVSAVGEMFLLAELQVKQLMQSKSTRRLQNALKAITFGTSTYETAYESAMDRIQSQDKRICELAKNAISILAYAERPLLAPELVHALSVDLDFDEDADSQLHKLGDLQSNKDSLGVYDPDLIPTVEEVLAASAGLIVHQPDSDIVQLVHKTTKEYLMSDDGMQKWFPRAQLTIAAICLIYSQAFEDSGGTANWPFLDYAQKHYGHHIMAQQSLERIEELAHAKFPHGSTLDPKSSLLQAQQLTDQIGLARMAQELGRTEDILIMACENNELNFARVLLSTKQYSRPAGQSEKTDTEWVYAKEGYAIDRGLLAAVKKGHLELVELLLKNGASPMTLDIELQGVRSRGRSLLVVASSEGHHDVVVYLLNHGYFTMEMMDHDDDRWGPDSPSAPKPRDFLAISPICEAALRGHVSCIKSLWKWIEIKTDAGARDAERERILENVTWCAMAGSHVHVLKILPRLKSSNMASMLRGMKTPNLLFTSIRWRHQSVAEFFLRSYTFDLSVRDETGVNALALAAGLRHMSKVVHLILEQRPDLLNSQDQSGRTPLSWAASGNTASVGVLVRQNGIQAQLVDATGLAPIDYLIVQPVTTSKLYTLSHILPFVEHGINRNVWDGCTLLHVLIDASFWGLWLELGHDDHLLCHWEKLKRYEGRNILDCRQDWESGFVRMSGNLEHVPLAYIDYRDYVPAFRLVLLTASVSAAEVRSSSCKCGIGSIFLAVSTEIVELVEVLLDLYPELVNDRFYDGSSPLDLARCIIDGQRRQSMIDLILSKTPIVETCKADAPISSIGEAESGETREDCNLTDLEIRQGHTAHTIDIE